MFKKKDDLRTIFVVLIVCAICGGVIFILNYKSNFDKLEAVDDYNIFFSNVNCVNEYINYAALKDNKAVYELLNSKYIRDNEITYDNVLDNTSDYTFNSFLSADSMSFVKVGKDFIYYISGTVYENVLDGKNTIDDNFAIILIHDTSNSSYSLYPINDDNYESIINKFWFVNIKTNNYNNIKESDNLTKEQICVIYLADYIEKMTFNINDAYNLLSDRMKEIYTSVNAFSKYIDDNGSLISIVADKCKVDETNDIRIYSVIDSYENKYVFTEESVMDYKVDFYLKEANE